MNPRTSNGLTVLVVEHSESARRRLCADIRKEPGVRLVLEADSGGAVLPAFWSHRPDLVLLAVGLPDVSGFELLSTIRSADTACAVVMLSDSLDPLIGEVSRLCGATDVCGRSGEQSKILALVRQLASQRKEKSCQLCTQ